MNERPSRGLLILAFAAVYVIWGSTYLAILYAVETIPPLLLVGIRFTLAGSLLYGGARLIGAPAPKGHQWLAAGMIGLLMVGSNVGVCWSEQSVPSGVAALLITTVPLWMVLVNWVRRGGVRPTRIDLVGIGLGFAGVVLLVSGGGGAVADGGVEAVAGGGRSLNPIGAGVLILSSLTWSIGSIWSRHVELPSSPLIATAAQMLGGGVVVLVLSTVLGDWSRLAENGITVRSALSVVYLALFGSVVAFTAYVWLLRVTTPTLVSTYAFVNPAVAMFLGFLLAGEALTARDLVATAVIIAAVVLITMKAYFFGAGAGVSKAPIPRIEEASLAVERA